MKPSKPRKSKLGPLKSEGLGRAGTSYRGKYLARMDRAHEDLRKDYVSRVQRRSPKKV